MREIMIKEASSCDLKELILKAPKFDLGKQLKEEALRGDYTAEDVGVKVDRPAVEEFTEIIGA
ncbi:hypothetical protein DY000_02038625 [Brassica cretica]|uniref:Uncharacterized protein n=1 Tax=Brassica cretica TaxID=69181 RepID=A0ABQ7BBX0_BRACR|nr:hypothetical protein DY000_02038625 [Brassica cretica]